MEKKCYSEENMKIPQLIKKNKGLNSRVGSPKLNKYLELFKIK